MKTLKQTLLLILLVPVVLALLPAFLLIGAWFWCLDPEEARADMA